MLNMNQNLESQIPNGKIFKDSAFGVATFIGGPLVAGYLFSENFKTLGQPEKVKLTWGITLVVTIAIFGCAFFIPDDTAIPGQIIPITYTAIAYFLFKRYQEGSANKHIESGGLIYSWWRVVGVGLMGLLITVSLIFVLVFSYEKVEEVNITTRTYGNSVKNEIDFDQTNISEIEIDNIADSFIAAGFFDSSYAKYVYVAKNKETYEISFSVVDGMESDVEAIESFKELRNQMDDYLPNHSIVFKFVVDYLDNVVKVLK